jgi:hypothetical protein
MTAARWCRDDVGHMTAPEIARSLGGRPSGRGWLARCPAHDDHDPSLSIDEAEDGRPLVICRAGCDKTAVIDALRRRGLWPSNGARPSRKIVATYDYQDETGQVAYQVVRYSPKDFRQRRPDGVGGWIWSLRDTPRVLYRLPRVIEAVALGHLVAITEGERDADNLDRLRVCATTNVGGAGKWRPEYTEYLRGAEVVIFPDRDEPGLNHAQTIAASLAGIAKRIRILSLPGLPDKGDVTDWISAGGTAQKLHDLIAAARDWVPASAWLEPDMRLVDDDRAPAPVLDDDALPAGWERWIAAEAEARNCPRDYIAAALIGAASAWIGNARRIAATADWTEPAHVWIALVGAPSTGKTPALRPMIEASRLVEREAEPVWCEACARHERDTEIARATDRTWREAVRDAVQAGESPPDRPSGAEASEPPPRPRIVAMDASTEELQHMLAGNPRGLLVVRDELAGWLGGFDRYGGRGADRAFYLEAWNGGAYVCDRVRYHGAPVRIEHASLAILGGMVPDRLREVLADADDGLAARLIYVWPEPMPIARLADHGDDNTAQRRNRLMTAARRLRGLAMGADDHGEPAPRALRLDDDARELFDELRRDAMEQARDASGLAAGWRGKTPGRALRLALVYQMLAWAAEPTSAEPTSVSADAVARVGGYLDYAAGMLDRVTAGLAIGRAEADAAIIGRHLLATSAKRMNERALYRTAGYAWARDADRRGAALAVLEHAGWIGRSDPGGHGRPRGEWEVSPRLAEARR